MLIHLSDTSGKDLSFEVEPLDTIFGIKQLYCKAKKILLSPHYFKLRLISTSEEDDNSWNFRIMHDNEKSLNDYNLQHDSHFFVHYSLKGKINCST